MTIGALAAAEHVRPQSVGQTVDALDQQGWGERRRQRGDRQVVVDVTDAGRSALVIGRRLRRAWLIAALATRFSPDERQRVINALELLQRLVDD